jgi:hypothetical protein
LGKEVWLKKQQQQRITTSVHKKSGEEWKKKMNASDCWVVGGRKLLKKIKLNQLKTELSLYWKDRKSME